MLQVVGSTPAPILIIYIRKGGWGGRERQYIYGRREERTRERKRERGENERTRERENKKEREREREREIGNERQREREREGEIERGREKRRMREKERERETFAGATIFGLIGHRVKLKLVFILDFFAELAHFALFIYIFR